MRAHRCPRYAARTDRLEIYKDAMHAIKPLQPGRLSMAPQGCSYFPTEHSIDSLKASVVHCFREPAYLEWSYLPPRQLDDGTPMAPLDVFFLKDLLLANHEFARVC